MNKNKSGSFRYLRKWLTSISKKKKKRKKKESFVVRMHPATILGLSHPACMASEESLLGEQ